MKDIWRWFLRRNNRVEALEPMEERRSIDSLRRLESVSDRLELIAQRIEAQYKGAS